MTIQHNHASVAAVTQTGFNDLLQFVLVICSNNESTTRVQHWSANCRGKEGQEHCVLKYDDDFMK